MLLAFLKLRPAGDYEYPYGEAGSKLINVGDKSGTVALMACRTAGQECPEK
jgi:hypothetical protein